MTDEDDVWCPKSHYKRASYLASIFWKRYLPEYVSLLQVRQKNLSPHRNLCEGDLVLMTGEGHARGFWPLVRVVNAVPDDDGYVRTVTVRRPDKAEKLRPITQLALLEAAS